MFDLLNETARFKSSLLHKAHMLWLTVVIPLRSWLLNQQEKHIFNCFSVFLQVYEHIALQWTFFLSVLVCLTFLFCLSPSVTQGCWWFLKLYRTAVYTKWPAATDTTVCLLCAGNIPAPKLCCSAQEASMERVWWDFSSHRTPLQQVEYKCCDSPTYHIDSYVSIVLPYITQYMHKHIRLLYMTVVVGFSFFLWCSDEDSLNPQ